MGKDSMSMMRLRENHTEVEDGRIEISTHRISLQAGP